MPEPHLTPATLDAYFAKTLDPEALLAASVHLEQCDACRSLVSEDPGVADRLHSARATFDADADVDHPEYETLAAFVDGTLAAADRQTIEQHVSECDVCTDDVDELRKVRAEIQMAGPVETTEPFSIVRWAVAAVVLIAAGGVVWWMMPPAVKSTLPGVSTARVIPTPPPVDERFALNDPIGRVSVKQDGTITGLEGLSRDDAGVVSDVLRSGRVALPALLADLRPPAGALMGPDATRTATFSVVTPVGTAIETDRPAFRWSAAPGASTYRVTVFDRALHMVSDSSGITATSWTPARPLPRGVVYTWQVTADTTTGSIVAPRPGTPEARFSVLADQDVAAIRAIRERAGGSHLALGILYAQRGLMDDAVRELEALQTANPGSAVATDLLEQVRGK